MHRRSTAAPSPQTGSGATVTVNVTVVAVGRRVLVRRHVGRGVGAEHRLRERACRCPGSSPLPRTSRRPRGHRLPSVAMRVADRDAVGVRRRRAHRDRSPSTRELHRAANAGCGRHVAVKVTASPYDGRVHSRSTTVDVSARSTRLRERVGAGYVIGAARVVGSDLVVTGGEAGDDERRGCRRRRCTGCAGGRRPSTVNCTVPVGTSPYGTPITAAVNVTLSPNDRRVDVRGQGRWSWPRARPSGRAGSRCSGRSCPSRCSRR